MRKFSNNAIRDTDKGKINYHGFRHPLTEHSFGKYMLENRKMPDGSLRDPDNWWGTWDEKISIDSMVRHVTDLEAIQAGYYVVKYRDGDKETTEYLTFKPKEGKIVSKEDCYNAIRFNATAGLLKHLTS